MIDTVRYKQQHQLLEDNPQGWDAKRLYGWKKIPNHFGKSSGISICCGGGIVSAIQLTMPKIIFGTNRNLISTQGQINEVYAKAGELIQKYALPTETSRIFTRVDLVWQFFANPQAFILAHKNCIHPEIRFVCVYNNSSRLTGITWGKGKARMKIRMYDKTIRALKALPVVRLEIELVGEKLDDVLNNGHPVTSLNIRDCYTAYREKIVMFQPKSVPILYPRDQVLAYAESAGVNVLELLGINRNASQLPELRKTIAKLQLRKHRVDWHSLLPVNKLPPVYNGGIRQPIKLRFTSSKHRKGTI